MSNVSKEHRKTLREQRDSAHLDDRSENSRIISRNVLKLKYFADAKIIFSYISFESEVDTSPILSALSDKIIVVPKMHHKELNVCVMHNLRFLTPNKFGIMEPLECKKIDPSKIDVALIPGIAFDKEGNRLGFGGGYFDRFLKKLYCPTIGLAYELQMIEKVPTDSYDVPVDMIVTERRVIKCKR